MRLIGSGVGWAGATSRPVSAKPGATLTIAAWVRSSEANASIDNVYVRFFGVAGFLGQQGPAIPAHADQWRLASAAVRVPEGALTADASIQVRSKGSVWIGAVGLFEGDVTERLSSLLPKPALQ